MNRERKDDRRGPDPAGTPRRQRRSDADDHVVARVGPAQPTPRRYEEPDEDPVMPARDATLKTKI